MSIRGRRPSRWTVSACADARAGRFVASIIIVAAAAGLPGATALATDVTDAGTAASAKPEVGPLYAAPTRRDQVGRVLAAVKINGQGPLRFIVDTGSNRSAIAPETVAKLGLTIRPQDLVDV